MKTCTKCNEAKAVSEFYVNKGTAASHCKKCHCREAQARRVAKRIDPVQVEKERVAAKKYRDANPEYVNRERARVRNRFLSLSSTEKEKLYEYSKLYFRTHRAESLARNAKYRANKYGAPGYCSPEQRKARFAIFGDRCAYCHGPAEAADHVIALTRGGSNWPANLRPSCNSCNSSKCNKKLMSEWKPPVAVTV